MNRNDPSYPLPSSPNVSSVMRGNRRSNTRPEVRIRSYLHRQGYRFRKDYQINANGRNCRPDIVFTKQRLAIFIDGCFWHQCPDHGRIPSVNKGYWEKKLLGNTKRDKEDTSSLRVAGWRVVRIWEHVSLEDAVKAIKDELIRLTIGD